MVHHQTSTFLPTKCVFFTIIFITLCVNVQTQLPVNPVDPNAPTPGPPPPVENTYEAPVLNGGLGTVSDGKEAEIKRRRYPDRSSSYSQAYDPGSAFRAQQEPALPQTPVEKQQPTLQQQQVPPPKQTKTFAYDPYPTRNATNDNVLTREILAPVTRVETSTARIPNPKVGSTTRDPFNDPNRYRIPSQQENQEDVRFVNGRPYR